MRERVFDRFWRGGNAGDTRSGGSGLGLAIVAAATAAHGGRTWAEAGPGGTGTHIVVELPARPPV
jgi:signal transduction histidine kinase